MFWTAKTALQTRLTKQLRLEAEAGVALFERYQQRARDYRHNGARIRIVAGRDPVLLPIQSVPPSGSAIDWVGSISLIYTLKTAELALSVARTIGPTTFGQFLKN